MVVAGRHAPASERAAQTADTEIELDAGIEE
jgi:hypothetical protein